MGGIRGRRGAPARGDSPRTGPVPPTGDEGFSLVEVMVAMAIFLVISAATLSLIMTAITTVRGNADRVYAAALARAEVDFLRTQGSAAIPLGASTRTVTASGGDYTVTRTATWVDVGATTNPCSVGPGVVPGKSYLRVRIDVEGQELDAPQTVDAIIYPNDTEPTQNTGTMTVSVGDNLGEPVSGVTVTITSSGSTYTYSQVTGPDGCVFFPDLVASPGWTAVISRAGFITQTPGANSSTGIVINELQNTPVAFTYAQSGSITFTAGGGGFPVPSGMPFRFQPNTWNKPANAAGGYPVTVSGLWPDQYTGWLLPCSASVTGSTGSVVLAAGGTASLSLGGTRLELVGAAGDSVRAVPASPCTNEYLLGNWDQTNLKQITLPAGTWTMRSGGVAKTIVLAPGLGQCSVSWNVPDAITQAEYDALLADPDLNLTPADLAGLTILPEVSNPCPTGP